jgi:alpha-L-rhamnosidase
MFRTLHAQRFLPQRRATFAFEIRLYSLFAAVFLVLPMTAWAIQPSGVEAPNHLRCESLETPLGIDTPQPRFSWQLEDTRSGAKQTAYQIEVFSHPVAVGAAKADVWDSGRIDSDQSVAVPYRGPALEAEHRYYWRVQAWDKDGAAYPTSEMTWWETGLMQSGWAAKWIGFELPEHRALRESAAVWITNPDNGPVSGDTHHDFRTRFTVSAPVRLAQLYVTGKDTAAAWVNGKPVLQAEPLPPYKQTPWKKYVEREVTSLIHPGENLLAIDVTLFNIGDANSGAKNSRTPMSACLYIEKQDGTVQLLTTGSRGWKAFLNAPDGWNQPDFNDASWPEAIAAEAKGSSGDAGAGRPWPTGPVKMLRSGFDVEKPIRSARLYATALGAYRFWINGQPVGQQYLAPGWTDYRERVVYQIYDVTEQLQNGKNAIGAYLAPGWYATPLQWTQEPNNYGATPPALRAQLRIEHTDGSVTWINTDESWQAAVSPIEKAEIYDGETYDARREQPGWSTASFTATNWQNAQLVEPHEPEIVAQDFQPIRLERTLRAKSITQAKPGVYVIDFGQNMAGLPRLRVHGTAGSQIQLRFAEVLNPDGTIYTENLRTALATDRYTLAGRGEEEYEPSFTFHGFRYVEITGIGYKPTEDTVVAEVLHTDAPFAITLNSGSSMINQLWSNILWGQRSNFVGVPTDCPQRDERLGWTGDAEVFWRTASYDMDLTQFSKKFAADLRSTQVGTPMYGIFAPGTSTPNAGHGAGWSDAGIIVPWTSWLQSGDTRIIDQNWDAMTRYLAAIEQQNPNFLWAQDAGIPFGDWLSPEGKTKALLIQTAYWAYDVTLMQQMAHATGRSAEEQTYSELFDKIRSAFAKEFVHADGVIDGADNTPSQFGGVFETKAVQSGETQTGYVLALAMHLVPDPLRQAAAADRLVSKLRANGWRLGTGFLGTPYLLAVLVDTGHADVAYRLLLSTEYPSWGYLVDHGATTMWERWNGDQMRDDPSMNSYNHYAYGAVADWIYRYAAGVDATPADAGFHTVLLHPNFDRRLGSLDLSYASPYGPIQSRWTVQGSSATWDVSIPANARAQLSLTSAQVAQFSLAGQPLAHNAQLHTEQGPAGETVYTLPAGSYTLTVRDLPTNDSSSGSSSGSHGS